jgi:hypothetical protein
MDDIKWGTKVILRALDGGYTITGFFLEYAEKSDTYWVNCDGTDCAYDAAAYVISKVERDSHELMVMGFDRIDELMGNGIPANLMYSVYGKVWRRVPSDVSLFKRDWKFIEIKQ